MAEYRIYLLRKGSIRGRHDFEAASDQHATQIAHALLDTCSDDCDSFDLWSEIRHVAVPRPFVPKTFDELSEVLQERTLEIEEQIAGGEWLQAEVSACSKPSKAKRSRRLADIWLKPRGTSSKARIMSRVSVRLLPT